MSQIPELPQPGVEVIQEFQAASPSIVVPTLVPCIVGVANEIRELFDADGNLNSDILVSGQAVATAPIAEPYNLANKTLELRISGGVVQSFSFDGTATALTAQDLASLIIAATPAPVGFSAYVAEDSGTYYLQLRTTARGEDKTIQFVDDDASAVLGFGLNYTYYGLGNYQQDGVFLAQTSFPDPRSNLEELNIDEDSIRMFVDLSTTVVELLKTEAFLRRGTTIAYVDDNDGDQLTPYVEMSGEDFKALPTQAIVTGTRDLNSLRQEINQQVLALQLDGGNKQFIKFYGAGIISDAVSGWTFGNVTGNDLNLTVNGAAVNVTTITATDLEDLVTEINVASQAAISANIAYESDAAGTEQTAGTGTHLGLIYGAVPSSLIDKDAAVVVQDTSTAALLDEVFASLRPTGTGDDITADTPVTGTATLDDAGASFTVDMVGKNVIITGATGANNGTFAITAVNSGTQLEYTNASAITETVALTWQISGDVEQPLWGDHTTVNGGALSGGPYENIDIEAQIDAMYTSSLASMNGSDQLVLTSQKLGTESKVEILATPDSTSTCLTALGLTAAVTDGGPFAARVGDWVYADGVLIGMIIEVHPAASTGRLKLDREVSTSASWSSWYIVAKNLDTVLSAQWGQTVPTPDFYLDGNGDVIVKHDFLRDTTGAPIVTTNVPLYAMYNALRLDVSSESADPSLLAFDSTTDLDAALDPVSPDNPLSYGLFCALGNAGAVQVAGIGVSETTADKPNGTVLGYSKAFEFLESEEVYSIGCMTSDPDIASIAQVHVNAMSEPEMKGERIVIIHLGNPTRKVDDIAASGNDGDSVAGGPPYKFDTKIATLSQALLALGVDPTSSFTADEEIFLDLASDAKQYNIIGPVESGTIVKLNFAFNPTQNTDSFFSDDTGDWTTGLPLVSSSFSVKRRGALVASKNEEIEAIYNTGKAYQDRRVWMVQLDKLRATVNGIEQLIDGFYMNAAKAGQVGGLSPAQPLTNYPIAVFTGVTGTKDRYNTVQLNQGAAGGADWIIQAAAAAPLTSRHQVTTDLTSIEKREQSIVKAVDYCAKFFRVSLQQYVGRYNITPVYLDTLSSVVQGIARWLVEEGAVVADADLNNLIQSEDAPDTVLIDVSLEVWYPGNYLRLTLIV